MGYFNFKVIDGYAINAADGYEFITPWIDMKKATAYSITVSFTTGSPSGTLVLQASNESDIGSPMGFITPATPPGTSMIGTVNVLGPQPQFNGADAITLTGTSTSISGTGTTLFDTGFLFTSPAGHRWVRLKYTATSGTSVVNAWCNVKFH